MGLIYLIRHGEPQFTNGYSVSEDPEAPRYYGSLDLELSPLGTKQARNLKEPLQSLATATLVTSPMIRARHTAEHIFQDKTYQVEPDFREIDLGEWEGQTFREIQEKSPESFEERWQNIEFFRSPRGESFEDLRNRVIPAFEKTLTKNPQGPLVITAHGGVFLVILREVLNLSLPQVFNLHQDYCGIHVLESKGSSFKARQLNWHPQIF